MLTNADRIKSNFSRGGPNPTFLRGSGVLPLYIALLSAFIALSFEGSFWVAAGYALCGYAMSRVLLQPDRPLSIRWIIILLASVQWVLAPHAAYKGVYDHFKYYMYVPQDIYMPIVVSGLLAFSAGLFAVGVRSERQAQLGAITKIPRLVQAAPLLPIALIGISLVGSIALRFVPGEVAFIAYLASNLKYSAVIMLILSGRGDRHAWVGLVLGVAALEAASTSLFHDVVLWSMLVGSYYAFTMRVSVRTRAITIVMAVILGIAVQSVKPEFRRSYWDTGAGEASAYAELTAKRLNQMLSGEITMAESVGGLVMRLNQGWIISRIIYQVPDIRPYAGADSLTRAVEAALIPRFLSPNKTTAGGRENFEQFTGLPLAKGASMGVSLLGEAYASFGPLWGPAFLSVIGALIAATLTLILRLAARVPLLICFLPNVMLHAVKAESDLTSVLNFILKSSAFHIALAFGLTAAFGLLRFQRRPLTQPLYVIGRKQ